MNRHDSEKDAQRLEVAVFGQTFRMRAPVEEHARLQRAARHVEKVMKDLHSAQPTPDTVRLAIQSAIIITVEYFKTMDDAATQSGTTDETRRRVDDLIQRLEESLSQF